MQLAWSRIWTRVAVSISYDDNHYTMDFVSVQECKEIYTLNVMSHSLGYNMKTCSRISMKVYFKYMADVVSDVSLGSLGSFFHHHTPLTQQSLSGVDRSTSHMSSSILLQQCPACLARLILIIFVMSGRSPYSWCFVGCCLQDLFIIARNILVKCRQAFSLDA